MGVEIARPDTAAEHDVAALRELLPGAVYACVREPVVDPACPHASDIDVLVFDDSDALVPQRTTIVAGTGARRSVDLLRVPAALLQDPSALAGYGLIAHRLLAGREIAASPPFAELAARTRQLATEPPARDQRIRGFLEMGAYTVREIGITWHFPELALLWSALAQAACCAAWIDVLGGTCSNVYTRPLAYLRSIEGVGGDGLEARFVAAARLDADFGAAARRLRRMHDTLVARVPEPDWPDDMRATTRAEFRYFAAREELDFRLAAAHEMRERGDARAGLFYLRFHGYMLARIPMVARCAREGRDVSFVRPERAVRRTLQDECPEILEDLRALLGGEESCSVADVQRSLAVTLALRRTCVSSLEARGCELGVPTTWEPCRPPPDGGRT